MAEQKSKTSLPRLAKLTPPSLPIVLNRTRLFRGLDPATRLPLTWLAAPPGAGKTTLLASYLQKRAPTVLWYRLDARDSDPSTLFHYLGTAVQHATPRFRTRLPHLTPEYLAGLPTFTQRFFEQLGTRFRYPTVLVFDNYQEVSPDALLHQLLPVGISQLPHHVRVVVLSRERPPASYARLQAEQQLATIPPADLELTREEARQLFRLKQTTSRKKAPLDAVDQYWELTKGWMAGFVLMMQQYEQAISPVNVATHERAQAVFDYIAGEVLTRFPPDSQKLLLTVSILSDFTPLIAQTLSLVPQAADILEELHQSRYFVERREDRAGWYRFHPLFQEFLLRRAEQTWDPTVMRELRRQAAALMVEAHCEDDAVHLLQRAEAWDDYGALIRTQAPMLAQQGRLQTLEMWIRQIPTAQRESDPWMDFWVANTRLLAAPTEASALYESAMTRFQQQGERAGMLLAWAGAVQAILVAWTGMKHLHDLVRVFEEMHPNGTTYPSLEVEAVVAQAMAGVYMQMYPDRPQARAWLDRSVELVHALPLSMRASEMVNTTIFYVQLGDGQKAQEVFAHQQRAWGPTASTSMRVTMALTECTLAWWSGDIERFRNAVQSALDRAQREGLVTWNWVIYSQAIYNELLFGNTRAARDYLHLMEPFTTFCACRLNAIIFGGWADLIDGQIDQVWQKCRQGREIMEMEGGPVLHTGFLDLLEAQALMARGRRAEAERQLEKVEAVARAIPWFFLFGVFFLRAQWAFHDGDEERGRVWLRRLLEEGKNNQQISFMGWIPAEASRLFAKALELGMDVPYVVESIRKWQLKPPADGNVPENWPWRVKVCTLGKFIVEVDGRPLEKNRKAPHRLLELLASIVAFGGQDVPVSRVIDALWPEVNGDTAQENFKKSIARLRKLLAVENVILWQDGKVSLNWELCWVDALVFESALKPTVTVHSQGPVDTQARRLYQGPFLGLDACPSWASPQREQLRERYVSLLLTHSRRPEVTQQPEQLIHSLQQAVACDPLAEPLYRRLIELLVAQGRKTDARRYYQVCREASQRWGTKDLSPETLSLEKRLTE